MPTHKVTVEGFAPFEVEEGTKLALAIERAGIDISHRCGGNAECTTCRVQFHTPEPPMGHKEGIRLEEEGVLGQFRLACQVRVDRNMKVTVLMRAKEQGWTPGVELQP